MEFVNENILSFRKNLTLGTSDEEEEGEETQSEGGPGDDGPGDEEEVEE
jgi:hypothetical protein